METYWNFVALEAKELRVKKWKKTARNWLADYADRRASDFIMKVINEVIKPRESIRVLDVGCGPGKWSIRFAKEFFSVDAIDISQNMIRLAEENVRKENLKNVRFNVMNVSKLDFPDEEYEFVNCTTVLQHIHVDSDWKKAIHEMTRVTNKNGHILLFEMAPSLIIKKRTPNLSLRTMHQYIREFKKAGARLIYWRAVDLSLPITYFGLKNYAASFNKRVYFFITERKILSADFLSFLSLVASLFARLVDYRLAESPLGFLSFGRILLFQKYGD